MYKYKVRWREVESFFKKRGFYILDTKRNKMIASPEKKGLRDVVVIPEKCSDVGSAEVTRPFLKQIERVFGITAKQIKAG